MAKRWICLDIDGTITDDSHKIPSAVIEYLTQLHSSGFRFAFITGRAFTFAMSAMEQIPFPYVFAVQNGADILEMPKRAVLKQAYLSFELIERLDALYEPFMEDYLIYSGWQQGDFCYYRPQGFSKEMTEHLHLLMKLVEEPWRPLSSFSELSGHSFPLIKCLGQRSSMESLEKKLKSLDDIQVSCIKDPLSHQGIYLNLITDKSASKGQVVSYLRERYGKDALCIAAGDDRNDISLLEQADIAIAMQGAPDDLIELADIIAPPCRELGIIKALQRAIEL